MIPFGKHKECDICGSRIGFFGSTSLSDGIACDRCLSKAEIARGVFQWKKESLTSVNRYIWDFENERAKLLEMLGDDASVLRVVSSSIAKMEEIMVGLPVARALEGHVLVYGYVLSGTFSGNRTAYILHDGLKIPVSVLAAREGNEKDDINILTASDQPVKKIDAPSKVKVILDIYNLEMLSKGDYIVLK